MKHNFYTFLYVFTFLLAASVPYATEAQCNCQDGQPSTPITYQVTMPPSNLANTRITFPKFDPSIGTLTCIVLKDSTSGVSTTHARNTAPQDVEYKFRLTVSTNLSGPGFNVDESFDKIYGPDTLRTFNSPGDSIVYGPDSVFLGVVHTSTTSSNVAPYLGTGTIDLDYSISGGLVSLKGGLNYLSQISTYTWGVFNLTYYWCPNALLSRAFKLFTAVKKDNNIELHWSINNEEASNQYDIQLSYDGLSFASIGQAASHVAVGATAEYYFEHLLKQAATGKLYFRIRQKDAAGKENYSPTRIVTVDGNGAASVAIYPNPVQRKVSLQFDRLLSGRFAVQIANASGQLLVQHMVNTSNTSLIQFELPRPLAPGVYYLRAQDLSTKQQYLSKLLVQ